MILVQNHVDWLLEWVPTTCYGGLPLRESLAAAWDAQGQLELAALKGTRLGIILLDYYKFFDSFEARFTAEMLTAAGVDERLSELFLQLNTKSK